MAEHTVIEKLLVNGPVLTDGAWGTEMQARGLGPGELPDLWNLSHPEQVEAVARSYVEAGSQVLLTNTFRANRFALGRRGDAAKVIDINRAGVAASRRAAGGRAQVFASIGPSGKLLMMGETNEAELLAAFREQAEALAAAGADAIVLETMTDLAEAKLALWAAKATGLPVVACMVFDSGENKDRTMMGVTPERAAEELAAAGADVVGANCGSGIEGYVPVCRRLAAATHLPLWIKPNAGSPELVGGRAVYRITPEQFASHVPRLLEAGAQFVGGCCGTNPAFIEAVRVTMAQTLHGAGNESERSFGGERNSI
jgi:methionine synthase I (cobalamin-dependent)